MDFTPELKFPVTFKPKNHMRTIIFILMIQLLYSCHQKKDTLKNKDRSTDLISTDQVQPSSIDQNRTDLDSIKKNLNLDSARLLGSMTNSEIKILLVYGDKTDETYREQGLYICPIVGNIFHLDSLKSSRFSLPGNQYNMFDSLVYQSRVFYGDCTEMFPFSVIWHQKEKQKNGNWLTNYFVLTLNNKDQFSLRLDEDAINLKEILDNIRLGKCKEMPGLDIYLEP